MTGFNDPHEVVKYLVAHNYPRDARIVDFGCGTGILGIELRKEGYSNIVGIDASQGMVDVCKGKTHGGSLVY